ncbi:MAG: carboxypeptidase-like regulatory domain-containing protein [Thermoplasmata archaeon]
MHRAKKSAVIVALLMILTVFGSIDAAASQGTIVPSYSADNGWDKDGNGLYDKLNVTIMINVTVAGVFHIQPRLFDNAGSQQIDYYPFDVNLIVGNTSLLIQYQGVKIRDSGFDGPYRINIDLYNDVWALIDSKTIFTSPYLHTEFERYRLENTLIHSDYAYNIDSDPRFDYLRVNVTYNVWKNGTYRFNAYLFDPSNIVQIDTYDTGYIYATVGTLNQSFDFKGTAIFTKGFDGQYRVRIQWYSFDDVYWRNDPVFATNAAYDHTMFQPPGIMPTMMTEQVIDTDGDSFYDELLLVFNVNIEVPGAYGLQVSVSHGSKYLASSSYVKGDLYKAVGNYTIPFSFDVGYMMDGYSTNASFVVTVYAKQYSMGAWTDFGTKTFTTATSYDSNLFKRKTVQAKIDGAPQCEFVDHDGDGKYDWVDATVNITCGVEDSFFLTTGLVSATTWKPVTSKQKEIQSIAGTKQVHVQMPAWPANLSGVDSPYRVYATLYTIDWDKQLSSQNAVLSKTCNSTDFNGTLPIEISLADDFGIDYNGDGKYDVLAVQLDVVSRESGIAYIYGYLKNETTTIDANNWYGACYKGKETPATLVYSGINIRKNAIESPYHLELKVSLEPEWNQFTVARLDLLHSYSPDMFDDPPQTTVTGRVIDEETGAPVSTASVTGTSTVWGSNSTATNSTGWFSMTLSSGLVSIMVAKSGYITRTLYIEAYGASATCLLEIKKTKADDSVAKGFVKLRDGSPIRPSTVTVMYVGDHWVKDLQTGPNGYYEIPTRSGPLILRFGYSLEEYGTVRLDVPASSTVWRNFTMQAGNLEIDNYDYLFTDWEHGWLEYEYFEATYDTQKDAIWADVFFGDSNGIVAAEEARLYAIYKYKNSFAQKYDTSRYLIVDGAYYLVDYGKMSFSVDGMTGPIESIVSAKYVFTASITARGTITPSDSMEIMLGANLDYEFVDWIYSCNYRIQLPEGFALQSFDSSENVTVSGTSLISVNPGIPMDRVMYKTGVILNIGSSTAEPEACAFAGRALLSDSDSHGGILIEVLNKKGDEIASTFTDTSGYYSLIGLPCEEMIVKATRSGYHPAGLAVRPIEKGLIEIPDITLHPATITNFLGSMNCTVKNSTSPIKGAVVTLRYFENSTLIGTLTTDENGKFEIHGLIPGAVIVNISAERYLPFECLEFVNGLATVESTYVLTLPSGGIRGRIIDDQGIAHEGVVVKLYDFAGQLIATTTTNATGHFVFEHIMDGRYNISIYWQDTNIGNFTNIIVENGTVTNIGTIEVPASAFGTPLDLTLFVIAAAAIIAIILGILWFMRRPPAKKEPRIEKLRPEEGVVVEEEEMPEPKNRKRDQARRVSYKEED